MYKMLNIIVKSQQFAKNGIINNIRLFPVTFQKCIECRKFGTIGRLIRVNRIWNRNLNSVRSQHNSVLRNTLNVRERSKIFDIDTNVQNNVLLFQHDKVKYYTIMLFFATMQTFAWVAIAYATYLLLPKDESTTFMDRLKHIKQHFIVYILFACACTFGPLACAIILFIRMHMVTHIILHKGGQMVSIGTPNYLLGTRYITKPVDDVWTYSSRTNVKAQHHALKIRGRSMYYLIPREGKFLNTDLYDCVIVKGR